ncbi:hypothetical protein ACRCF9_11700 [Pseudomonas canadensis]|uniref:hypothetical protein n=1 Tax=Pseudomonas TaxID=286 RepID=UPI003D6BBE01
MDGCQRYTATPKSPFTNVPAQACPPAVPANDTTNKDQKISIEINNSIPSPEKNTATQSFTLSDNQKFVIKLESDTDWPSVIATFVVGVAIAWFAYNTQKSQIRSSVANFRHDWQNNLRSKIAEFMSKIYLLQAAAHENTKHSSSSEYTKLYSEILLIQATVELMLDLKKDYTKDLTRLMEDTIKIAKSDPSELNRIVHELNLKANEVLEQAWQDIRKDLGLRRKKHKKL